MSLRWIGSWAVLALFVVGSLPAWGQTVPEDYHLVYHQDFEEESPLDDFAFSDEAAWKLVESSGDHTLALTQDSDYDPPVRSPRNFALIRGLEFDSFVLEAQVMYTGRDYGHADLCLFFGFRDPSHYYYTHIGKSQDPHAHQIFIVDGEPRTKITDRSRTDGFPWEKGRWEKVRVVRDGSTGKIEVYVRDMDEPILETTDSRFGSGRVGFGTFDDRGRINNIHVWAKAEDVRKVEANPFGQ